MSFISRYEYSLDTKGRLNIPAKFREVLLRDYDYNLVITTALDGYLDCYPRAVWSQLEEKFKTLPSSLKRFKRLYVSGAVECSLDKHGRVLLPPTLRNWAGLDQECNNVVIVGNMDKMEFWSQERWSIEESETIESSADINALLDELGVII
jgi:MraZ protein